MLKRLKCFTHRFKVYERWAVLYFSFAIIMHHIKMLLPIWISGRMNTILLCLRGAAFFFLESYFLRKIKLCFAQCEKGYAMCSFVFKIIRRLWKEKSQHQPNIAWNVKVFHRFKEEQKKLKPGKKDDPSYRYLCSTAKTDNKMRWWKNTYTEKETVRVKWSGATINPHYTYVYKQKCRCNTRIICKKVSLIFFTTLKVHESRMIERTVSEMAGDGVYFMQIAAQQTIKTTKATHNASANKMINILR